MFRFIHAADIHLDSPLKGLERYDGAPVEEIRLATRRALENLVQLAIDERAAFVVIAGDLYDGDRDDYNIVLFFNRQMKRLADAGIRVFLISGNHDAENKMTTTLNPPSNVHQFPTETAATAPLDDLRVAVHGQGFKTAAVQDDLSLSYPQPRPGYFNLGLLHTCASGSDGEHQRYAPCSLDGLRAKRYDYWALGHVHQRQHPWPEEPAIAFSGNIQGRHIRETGPKGCLLVTVDDNRNVHSEFRALDVFRWERCTIAADDADTAHDLVDCFGDRLRGLLVGSDGRPLAVRVEISGASPAHGDFAADQQRWINEIRARAIQDGLDRVWIEKVKLQTQAVQTPIDWDAADGPIGELLHLFKEMRSDPERLTALAEELGDLKKKIAVVQDGFGDVQLEDPHWLTGVLGDVEQMLLGRLLTHRTSA